MSNHPRGEEHLADAAHFWTYVLWMSAFQCGRGLLRAECAGPYAAIRVAKAGNIKSNLQRRIRSIEDEDSPLNQCGGCVKHRNDGFIHLLFRNTRRTRDRKQRNRGAVWRRVGKLYVRQGDLIRTKTSLLQKSGANPLRLAKNHRPSETGRSSTRRHP